MAHHLLIAASALALIALSGCVPAGSGTSGSSANGVVTSAPAKMSPTVTATLYDKSGTISVGSATLKQMASGGKTQLSLGITLPAGTYGMHLHSVGKCDAPDFTTAGPHWNPGGKQHGFDNPMGSHSGDLPNLVITGNGSDAMIINFGPISIGDLMDADGASLIIHANPDDYKTDPSGNSGGRIICGVFADLP